MPVLELFLAHKLRHSQLGDFTFWISLSLSLKFRIDTELNPKSEVTFLVWTQRIAQRR